VVVDDDRWHLGRGQVRVVHFFDESTVVLGAESPSEELLASSRRQKNHGVSKVDDRHATSAIEPPAMAY
jgi:hypothetical protein